MIVSLSPSIDSVITSQMNRPSMIDLIPKGTLIFNLFRADLNANRAELPATQGE
jgi:hypothetical protein